MRHSLIIGVCGQVSDGSPWASSSSGCARSQVVAALIVEVAILTLVEQGDSRVVTCQVSAGSGPGRSRHAHRLFVVEQDEAHEQQVGVF